MSGPRLFGTVGALGLLLLTGCTMAQLPSHDTVASETHTAMQEVVDTLPAGIEVQDRGDSLSACEDGGAYVTAHWVAYPDDGFDGVTFIDRLPGELGDGWETEDIAVEVAFPTARLVATQHGNAGMDVQAGDVDGKPYVDIYAMSRCGVDPDA